MDGLLFCRDGYIGDWLVQRQTDARAAVDQLPESRVLREPIAELTDEIVQEYALEEPMLRFDERYMPGVTETRIDVSRDPLRAVFDRSRPALVRGHHIEIHQPFDGDPHIVNLRTTTHNLNPPRGEIRGNQIVITFDVPADSANSENLKQNIETAFNNVAQYFEWAANDVRGFNRALPDIVRQALNVRRGQLEAGQGIEAALGIRVRRRDEANPTLAVQVAPRRPVTAVTKSAPSAAEPFLTDDDYRMVVEFIGSIRRPIERLPETFAHLPEPSLRDILLVILNNTFGPATGESFSSHGKTDIFIQTPGGPVFIAECKIWAGPKAFADAVDQLLGYLVWRDTKAALVVFVHGRDVSRITDTALSVLRQHQHYVRDSAAIGGDPTVLFHHAGDEHRLLRLAVIVVPVPQD